MTSIPPANPTNPPIPLPVEQLPPDITIPSFTPIKKSNNSLSVLFNILFLLFGIGGIGYGMYMQLQVSLLQQISLKNSAKLTTTQPSPTLKLSVIPSQATTPPATSSASTDETVMKDTLCFTLTLPKKNDVGAENNCDITYRSFPDPNNPDTSISMNITLYNKEYQSSQDIADQWIQMEKDLETKDTLIEKGPIQIGGVEGYKVVTEYPNKAVQTTHIFIYNPEKYEAYGYPITGFELLTASDVNTRPIQQKELERLLATWKWK